MKIKGIPTFLSHIDTDTFFFLCPNAIRKSKLERGRIFSQRPTFSGGLVAGKLCQELATIITGAGGVHLCESKKNLDFYCCVPSF
jgi:hypothetical protein